MNLLAKATVYALAYGTIAFSTAGAITGAKDGPIGMYNGLKDAYFRVTLKPIKAIPEVTKNFPYNIKGTGYKVFVQPINDISDIFSQAKKDLKESPIRSAVPLAIGAAAELSVLGYSLPIKWSRPPIRRRKRP